MHEIRNNFIKLIEMYDVRKILRLFQFCVLYKELHSKSLFSYV